MLMAAFTSALAAKPQAVQRKSAWLSRDLPSTYPHAEHRWLVYAALTFSTRPGALLLQAAYQQAPAGRGDLPVQPGFLPDVPAWVLGRPLCRASHVLDLQV